MSLIPPTLIIVTGRPAAGKSTLAKWLSQELKLPLVSKDSLREELFERLGWKDRPWAQELGKASIDMMFYFVRAQLARFKARADSGTRHSGHGDQAVLEELYANLADKSSAVLDIGGIVIEVDTTDFAKIDYPEILRRPKPLLLW